jgi:hypothetical protein
MKSMAVATLIKGMEVEAMMPLRIIKKALTP